MLLSKFVAGLIILKAHFRNEDGYHIGAEHDQFYVYATETPLSNDEFTTMRNLGWFQPDASDEDKYEPEEGWSCFT